MTATPYQHTTMAQAEAAMALRLAETAAAAYVRYLAAEIDLYLYEAVRTWNSLTSMYRAEVTAALPAGTVFADLRTLFPTQRGYSVTDRYLVGIIQYHLVEPFSPAAGTGMTEMFTLAGITAAIQRRRDQFLTDTGLVVTRHAPVPTAPALITEAQISLDPIILDIQRAAWASSRGKTTLLQRDSNFNLRTQSETGEELAVPHAYSFNETAPSVIQFGPPPLDTGTIDLITIDRGAVLNPATPVVLGVPDDYTPWIKWGAMADLLSSDGPARDYARSLYCERRYQLGVIAAQSAKSILDATIGGQPARFARLADLDNSELYWQDVPGTARTLAAAGLDLWAVCAPPTADTSLSANLVVRAPVIATIAAVDYLQVPYDQLDLIYGYAEHLALFKVGGRELAATTHLAQAFFDAARQWNAQLGAVFEDAEGELTRGPRFGQEPQGIQQQTGGTLR